MFYRLFMSALVSGLLGGLVVSGVQAVTTTPLILKAETYETAPPPAPIAAEGHAHAQRGAAAEGHSHGETWAPAEGAERTFFKVLTNVIAGMGFALLIVGCFALGRREPDAREGLLWGLAGFAVFTLAPGLGLAPELPATAAADLTARQTWWLGTVAASALGLWLLIFRPGLIGKALGVLVLIVPHAIGAPHPHVLTNAVPPELAAQFAAASIATQAVFWAGLGWLAGLTYQRFGDHAETEETSHRAAA